MFAIALSVVLGQVTLQRPAGLTSPDPKERLVAVREIAAQPAGEVQGVWLLEALSDSDPDVVMASVQAWRAYENGFCRELSDAIEEGNLDGRPVTEPAKSVQEWEKKLAAKLLEVARSSSLNQSVEVLRTLALLTDFAPSLDDPILLRVLRVGDPATLTNSFVVALRTFAKEKPKAILQMLESSEPPYAIGAIMSLGFQMPAEADGIYLAYLDKGLPAWQKAAMAGFSYRPNETRRRQISPFIRSGRLDVRQTAAEMCGFEDEDWKKIALDRNWPSATRTMAMAHRSIRSWEPEDLKRLHFDPDPYVQAEILTNNFPGYEDSPPNYDLLIERFQSGVPELRAACLLLVARIPELRKEALGRSFRDRSPIVRKRAAELSGNGEGFDAQRIQAYSDGLLADSGTVQVDFNLAVNQPLLEQNLRSLNDRKAVLAAWAVLPDRLRTAIPILVRCAKSGDEDVQTLGFAGLEYIGNEGGFEGIASVASPNNPKLFAVALRWMKEGVKSKALPFLKRHITHPNRKIRIAVKAKLAEFAKGETRAGI
jgi:hypothetical protein